MKHFIFIYFMLYAFNSSSQNNCIPLYCDNSAWVDQHIQTMENEVLEAPSLGIGICNSGTIRQCFYQGSPVYTYLESSYICDISTSVADCEGNLLFTFGGFCFPAPCPGELEADQLTDCVVLYSNATPNQPVCSTTTALPDCVNLACAGSPMDWLNDIKAQLLDPDQNPSLYGCVPSQSIVQADYLGQTVIIVTKGTCFLADEANRVFDCSGNFLFAYSGFCITQDGGPCPGDIQSQDLINFETIFDIANANYPICAEAAIPTMGEWGLICLGFLLLIVSIRAIQGSEEILTTSKSISS